VSKYLITPSLLNSYAYYIQDEWKSPADSRADFLKTLSRERFEPNQAMQKGIDFEDDIQQACEKRFRPKHKITSITGCPHGEGGDVEYSNEYDNYSKVVMSLSDIVKGGLWQESVKKELKIGNQEFLLYGRTDVIKRDTIYDIKFTSKYDLGKFSSSSQHLIYLYCSDLPKFSYLISDGKEWWKEDYANDNNIENKLKSMISDFMGYLENDKEAKEMFLTKWKSKNHNA
jgi:hypothetical protein